MKPSTRFTISGASAFDAAFFARAYLEVLCDSLPRFMHAPMEDQLVVFKVARNWPADRFIAYAKYCTAWPMAKFLNQELPVRPEGFVGSPVFSGKVKRMIKSRIVSKSMRNARLFQGLLQGVKRGCAPVTKDFVQKAMEQHRIALGSTPRGLAPDRDHIVRYQEFFSDFKWPKPELFEPKASASYQSKRSEGGAREFLRQELDNGFEGVLLKMVETSPGRIVEVRGTPCPSFQESVDKAVTGSRNVMVSAVLEPLKVRLITKGDSHRYFVSRYYQKALWRHLQRFPQFSPTSRPLNAADLVDLLARERELGVDFPNWVSGDYKSATDLLDIRHTKAAFEASLRLGMFSTGNNLREVLRSVLYEQTLHYPTSTRLAPVQQTTGQLMGSTLSFPILCCVNLVAYWRALERHLGVDIKIKDLPVLINGDDILFRADDALYTLWLEEIKSVGFELSLGKNYVHRKFLTINSQLYAYSNGYFTELGYLNTGLLTGQAKVTGRVDAKKAPVWDYYNMTVHSAVDPLRAHRRFFHYHRTTIESLTDKGRYNVFLPFERGGLGFLPPRGLKFRITNFQRRFAAFLDRNYHTDPLSRDTIALVSDVTCARLTFDHNTELFIGPKIGPLPLGVTPLRDREVNISPFAWPGADTEEHELRVRLPRASTLRAFKATTSPRMGNDEILTFPFAVYERKTCILTSPDQPTPTGWTPTPPSQHQLPWTAIKRSVSTKPQSLRPASLTPHAPNRCCCAQCATFCSTRCIN